ncbi:MAG: leucine-rich repeat domain-containing protein [Anaerolineaceae bacterium]|nr:leucine-rich repeat domain-containing protein [Anaerolineaceae bacterium]
MAQEGSRETHEFGQWEYTTNRTGLTITAYHGNEKQIDIPHEIQGIKVTALGDNLFKSNITLQSVSIPDTVSSVGSYAFHGCTSLSEIRLPSGLTRIEPYTFRYCTALTQITLPEALTVISAYAFSGCIGLTEIRIPDSVTQIGESAFEECASLAEVRQSKNLSTLGGYAFRSTSWLDSQTDEYVIIGNSILIKWNGNSLIADIPYGITMIVDAFEGNPYVESVVIPASVTRIGNNAFREAVNLKDINIPDSVTRIDSNTFQECRSLRSITIPESVTYLGNAVFRGCEKLTEIEIPFRVSTINSYAMADCDSLTDVVIPASVATIHETAFRNSNRVRLHVTYDSVGETYARTHSLNYTYYLQQTKDFIYSKNEDGVQILRYIGNLYDVDIPAEIDGSPVNRINTAAFQDNPIAKRISIPDSVTTVGDWAFSYMDSLEEVTLPASLKVLGADAFTGSVLLRRIVIPSGLESIGVEPFRGIDNLSIIVDETSKAAAALREMGYVLGEIAPEPVPVEKVEEVISEPEKAEIIETAEPVESVPVIADGFDEGTGEAIEDGFGDGTDEPVEDGFEEEPDVIVEDGFEDGFDDGSDDGSGEVVEDGFEDGFEEITVETAEPAPIIPTETVLIPEITPVEETPLPDLLIEPVKVLRIPEGTEAVTVDMLQNTSNELTLIIPDSVVSIDDAIAAGHDLTIVSSTKTYAEQFARKWDIKFLLKMWYEETEDSFSGDGNGL